jgi:hypothetical protein
MFWQCHPERQKSIGESIVEGAVVKSRLCKGVVDYNLATQCRGLKSLKEKVLADGFVKGVADVELTIRCRGFKSSKETLLGNKGLY